jgi:hypothetical protein
MGPISKTLAVAVLMMFMAGSLVAFVSGAGPDEGKAGGKAVILIHDVDDLQNMSLDLDGSYELANDIEASATKDWNGGKGFEPINGQFIGSLDGRGFTISNLFMNRPDEDCVALIVFLDVQSAGIRNLNLAGVDITGGYAIGALASNDSGPIDNCHVSGKISGKGYVGGLASVSASSLISNSSFSGSILSGDSAGGLLSIGVGDIYNCNVSGTVTGQDTVGGLCGANWKGRIWNCSSSATVSGTERVGGFVGYFTGNISRCHATGDVTGTTYVGGFAGYADNVNSWLEDMYDCYSTGKVSGTDKVGGLVGDIEAEGIPGNNYETGGNIIRCYSTGVVSGTSNAGGMIGKSLNANVTDCYWDTQTSACMSSAGGTGKTTVDMKKQATFANWDFVNVWKINEDVTYPYLREIPEIPINRAPTITTVPPTTATVGTLYSVQFAASDPDGDALAWSMSFDPGWLHMSVSGLLSGMPLVNQTGIYPVAVSVSDGRGGTASITFELTISEGQQQHEPVWTAVPSNTTLVEGDDFKFTASANDIDAGDTIVYGLTTSPACGLTMNTATGALEGLKVSVGDYTCVLTATDGHSVISHVFGLRVAKKPAEEPKIVTLSVPENVTVKASSVQTFSVEATSPTNATLTYEWKEKGVTLSTQKSFSRKFSPGNHTLILLIGDGRYTTARTFNFTVAQPPKTIDTKPVSIPGFEAGIAAAAVVTVVAVGLFWRREQR